MKATRKQTKAGRESNAMLAGEVILREVERGEFDLVDFLRMTDTSRVPPTGRCSIWSEQ